MVIYALEQHYYRFYDIEFVQEMYETLIHSAGNFLTDFVDRETDLPLPSYDLWERERGVFAYSVATVYAGLKAAANLSRILGHFNHYRRYASASKKIQKSILEHFYDAESGRFLKAIYVDKKTGEIKKDYTVDASIHALWMMGVLPADDPKIVKTNEVILEKLSVPTGVGGIARYEHDDYMRVLGDYSNIPGNPWIICTLWHAQWLIAKATSLAELKETEKYLEWTLDKMNPAGILPEQLSPFTGEHLSVSPLTWSHATFVDTVLKYNEKSRSFSKKQ